MVGGCLEIEELKSKRADLHEAQSGNFVLCPLSCRRQIYELLLISLRLSFQRKTSAASPAGDRMLSDALCLDGELSSPFESV